MSPEYVPRDIFYNNLSQYVPLLGHVHVLGGTARTFWRMCLLSGGGWRLYLRQIHRGNLGTSLLPGTSRNFLGVHKPFFGWCKKDDSLPTFKIDLRCSCLEMRACCSCYAALFRANFVLDAFSRRGQNGIHWCAATWSDSALGRKMSLCWFSVQAILEAPFRYFHGLLSTNYIRLSFVCRFLAVALGSAQFLEKALIRMRTSEFRSTSAGPRVQYDIKSDVYSITLSSQSNVLLALKPCFLRSQRWFLLGRCMQERMGETDVTQSTSNRLPLEATMDFVSKIIVVYLKSASTSLQKYKGFCE